METISRNSVDGKHTIKEIFHRNNLLSFYFTSGYPHLDDTLEILLNAQEAGVDFVEIGFPFSDPIADGPVIQESSTVALRNGMNLKVLFNQINAVKNKIQIPVILMGYLNPVLQFGIEKFCKECEKSGISGLIIPDLPIDEYENEYKEMFDASNLSFIFLITPQTSDARIRKIDSLSNAFIYVVSSSSTTGARERFTENQLEYLKRIDHMNLKNPVMVGFGISNHETFSDAVQYANGAIIGSAFISFIKENSFSKESIQEFINKIKEE